MKPSAQKISNNRSKSIFGWARAPSPSNAGRGRACSESFPHDARGTRNNKQQEHQTEVDNTLEERCSTRVGQYDIHSSCILTACFTTPSSIFKGEEEEDAEDMEVDDVSRRCYLHPGFT